MLPRFVLRLSFSAAVLVWSFDSLSVAEEIGAHRFARVSKLLEDSVSQEKIAGAVALVLHDDRIVYATAVGHRDREKSEPMRPDTIFRIASMTKPLTSVAVMQLRDRGKLQLDDPISKYIPTFANAKVLEVVGGETRLVDAAREVTVHDLLTHTSGVAYGFMAPEPLRARYEQAGIAEGLLESDATLAENALKLGRMPLACQPGSRWQYGLSTDVLGRVVEVASGRPFDQYLRQEVLEPLGMRDTHFVVPAEKLSRLAALYTPGEDGTLQLVSGRRTEGGVRYSATYQKPGASAYRSGGGGLVSTAPDYLRFLQMLLSDGAWDGVRIVKSGTVAEMTRNQIGELKIPFAIHGDQFGLGFGIHSQTSPQRMGASIGSYSWGGIFHTYFWVDPQREIAGVLMTQLFPFDHLTMWGDFQEAVYESLDGKSGDGPEDAERRPRKADSESGVRRARYQRHALTHAGDSVRGKTLFADTRRAKCAQCHLVGGRDDTGGEKVGPELTNIGGKFDRPHLIESLLEPSRQIVEGYRTSNVLLDDGRVLTGIVKNRNDARIVLVDLEGRRTVIARRNIEEIVESDVSLMPAQLETLMTAQEFTDVIAYLETLRPGGGKQGAGVVGPIELPAGFEVRTVATGLTGATALETLPDGRVLICEQTGAVRVVSDGRLLDEPFVKLPALADWERGVIGVTVHPDFPRTPHVYVCWVAGDPYPHHRVSRLTARGNAAVAGSEQVLFEGDDQRKLGGKVPAGHQGGALHFGVDGMLYVAIGEQTAATPAQQLDSLLGKILRLAPDGSIPTDNPFVEQTEGKYRAIWARGCRNPFTFAVRDSDGLMLINDVGGRQEEINIGRAGANYGWPVIEHGPERGYASENYDGPLHWYPQSSINGGDFCPDDAAGWGEFQGRYLFADFVHGWIKAIDPDSAVDPKRPQRAIPFASNIRRPVDLRFSSDGTLYVLLRNAWVVDGKFQSGTGSLIAIGRARKAESTE